MLKGFVHFISLAILIPVLFSETAISSYAASSPINLSVASYWCHDHDHPIPTDVNGDGLCDIVSQYGDDGSLYVTLTSKFGKPLPLIKMDLHLSGPSIAGVAGRFFNSPCEQSLFVLRDGPVEIVYASERGDQQYRHVDIVATLPENERPAEPAHLVKGDFDGDGMLDAAILGADGRLVILHNVSSKNGPAVFAPIAVEGSIGKDIKQFVSLNVNSDARARLIWITSDGKLMRSAMQILPGKQKIWKLKPPQILANVNPDSKMVAGRFTGYTPDDLIVGQSLFLGADPNRKADLPNLPTLEDSKLDAEWSAGDIDGNELDDLICKRGVQVGWGQKHIRILYASRPGDDWKGFVKSVPDGLLDSWKLGKLTPGGLNLKELGCKVGHRDLIVEINRFVGTDDVPLKAEMDRVAQYYASLPIKNPDGVSGIAIHYIYPPQIPTYRRDYIEAHYDDVFPAKPERGVVHCFIDDNGGVAKIWGDNGHFNGGLPIFVHEMGHNLGLTHEGSSTRPFSPLYHSLMNYAYNGTLGYNIDPLGYSHGALGSYFIDASHLSKMTPFPIDKVRFLSKNPYNFHIKPSADGKSTLVDWDWNGDFSEENVRANINYFPNMQVGDPHSIGVAQTAPVIVVNDSNGSQRLSVIYGRIASNEKGEASTLSLAKPGLLGIKSWQGDDVDKDGDKWSPETIIAPDSVTGDPSACPIGNDICLAYPSLKGVCVARAQFQKDSPIINNTLIIPNSIGAIPTVVSVDGLIKILLWRNERTPIGIVSINHSEDNWRSGLEKSMNIYSLGPLAATSGAKYGGAPSLVVSGLSSYNTEKTPWFCSCFYTLQNQNLVFQKMAWQSKLKSHPQRYRPVMLWEPYPGLEPDGRFYLFESKNDNNWFDMVMNTAYPNDDDGYRLSNGWLSRSIEHSSYSGPGAGFFRGDIAFAYRMKSSDDKDNNLFVSFHGRGIFPGKQGDFDDITLVQDYGLDLSIPEVTE